MLTDVFTRRAALFSFSAFLAAGLSGCNTTPPPGFSRGQPRGGAVDVDTTPLVAYVGNPTAGWVQQSLPGELASVLGPSAGGLHVRIDTLYLGNGGPGDPDLMRGVAIGRRQDDKGAGEFDLFSKPDRSGAAGTGAAGPRASAVGRLRLPAEEEAQGLTPGPLQARPRVRANGRAGLSRTAYLVSPRARLVLTALAAASLRWACG